VYEEVPSAAVSNITLRHTSMVMTVTLEFGDGKGRNERVHADLVEPDQFATRKAEGRGQHELPWQKGRGLSAPAYRIK
jgi:hypothetical protein